MNTYPATPPIIVGSSRTIRNPTYRSQSESGYTFSRKKWTRPKASYSLNYPSVDQNELKILQDFFNENQGQKFKFKYPYDEEKICVFTMDELQITDNEGGYSAVKIDLAEV